MSIEKDWEEWKERNCYNYDMSNELIKDVWMAGYNSNRLEKLSYVSTASSGVQITGKYIPDLKNIWEVKEIKLSNTKIKMVTDFTIPNDEIWFVDTDGDTQKFKMFQTP